MHAELLKNNWFYNDSGSSSSKVLNGREPAIENELCDVDNLLGAARHCCAAAMRCSAARTKSAILHSCRALGKQLAGGCQNFATFSLRAVLVGRPTVGCYFVTSPQIKCLIIIGSNLCSVLHADECKTKATRNTQYMISWLPPSNKKCNIVFIVAGRDAINQRHHVFPLPSHSS